MADLKRGGEYVSLSEGIKIGFSGKRQFPSGFIERLDFQTVVAMIEATASLRHLRPAFLRTSSEQILSDSLVLVIVRAVDFMAKLISSVMQTLDLQGAPYGVVMSNRTTELFTGDLLKSQIVS